MQKLVYSFREKLQTRTDYTGYSTEHLNWKTLKYPFKNAL